MRVKFVRGGRRYSLLIKLRTMRAGGSDRPLTWKGKKSPEFDQVFERCSEKLPGFDQVPGSEGRKLVGSDRVFRINRKRLAQVEPQAEAKVSGVRRLGHD